MADVFGDLADRPAHDRQHLQLHELLLGHRQPGDFQPTFACQHLEGWKSQ